LPKVPSAGSYTNTSSQKKSDSIQNNKNKNKFVHESSKMSTIKKQNKIMNSNSINNNKKRKEFIDQYSTSINNKIKSSFTHTKLPSTNTNTDITSNLKQASTNSYLYNYNYDYRKNANNNVNNKMTYTNQDLVNRLKNKSSALKFSITSKNYYINIKNKNQNVNSFQLEEEPNDKNNKKNKGNQDITQGVNILSKFDTFVHEIKYLQKDKNAFNKTSFNYYFDKSNNLKNTKSFDINFHNIENKSKDKKHVVIYAGKTKNKSKQDIVCVDKNDKINNENNEINNKENDKNKINIKNEKTQTNINKENTNEYISEIKIKNKDKIEIIINEEKEKDKPQSFIKKDFIDAKEYNEKNNNIKENNSIEKEKYDNKSQNQNKKKTEEIVKKEKNEKEIVKDNDKNNKKEEIKKEKETNKNELNNKNENKQKSENKDENKENKNDKNQNKKEEIKYNSPIKKNKSKKKKKTKENSSTTPIEIQFKPLSPKNNIERTDPDDLIPKYFTTTSIKDVQIPKDYLNIIYYNLLIEEKENRKNFKAEYNYMNNQKEINEQMRSILVDWIIDVHGKFGFCDETLFMTILIIDRYSSLKKITRNEYQCLGITALMIACKHEEINVPKVEDFIYITDNAYNKEEVFNMEIDILDKLKYNLLYPSPIKFFEYLSFHFGFDKKQHFLGKYLMETFLLDLPSIKFKPSIISCACAYVVMKFFKMKNYKESYSKKWYMIEGKEGYETESGCGVKDCAQELCNYADNINNTNYLSCQKKYSTDDYCNISKLIFNYQDNSNKKDGDKDKA